MSESTATAEAPQRGLPPDEGKGSGLWARYGVTAVFLGPALVLLAVWIVYPTLRTIYRSFFDRSGDEFVGIDNYETLFRDDTLLTAIQNNFLWLLIVPAFVTAIGLVFAVLLERVRFATGFKVAVFMPMAISLFAAGVIWRFMYEKDPDQGTINAGIAVVRDAVAPSGVLERALPSTDAIEGTPNSGLVLQTPLAPGGVARLGLTGIRTRRRARRSRARGRAGGALGRHHRGRLEGLHAGRWDSGHDRRGRARSSRVSRSSSGTRVAACSRRRRRRPTARSRSRRSPPGRTLQRSVPTRSPSPMPECRGSERA